MKLAIIIKHPYRDTDYRVDIIDVPEEIPHYLIREYIMSKMLGPFEVIAITEKVSDRDMTEFINHPQTKEALNK